MNNILEIEGLTFRYEDRNVLEDINLQVPKGAFFRFSWTEWFREIDFT